jgi:thiosulfate/3-mercaptopyruvate sulfurtransferase
LSAAAARPATFVSRLAAGLLLLPVCLSPPGAVLEAPPPLVDTTWLVGQLGHPALVVLDIRSPIGGADLRSYLEGHIPGAVYSDFMSDQWHDHDSGVPATLPDVAQLELLLGKLGVNNDSAVVLVHSGSDSSDFATAARVFWIFRLLGHDRVAILDGGMRAWTRAGLPLERGWNEPQVTTYRAATFRDEWLATTAQVADALGRGVLLIDARVREQYQGRTRAGPVARAGTLPGAINLEHRALIDPDTGLFVSADRLAALLQEVGIGPVEREIVCFCNFGHLSAALWFALHEVAGFRDVKLYDGSMADWAAAPERPVIVPRGDVTGSR